MTEIPLKTPVEFDGKTVASLTMRSPKVKDQLFVENYTKKSDTEKEILLMARLCDVPGELIEEMQLGDYKKLQDTFKDFLD